MAEGWALRLRTNKELRFLRTDNMSWTEFEHAIYWCATLQEAEERAASCGSKTCTIVTRDEVNKLLIERTLNYLADD